MALLDAALELGFELEVHDETGYSGYSESRDARQLTESVAAMNSPHVRPRPDPRTRRLTVDEYLRREARARVRHEYVAGFVYAMTGATIRHNRIVRNIATRLNAAAGYAARGDAV